MNKPRVLLADDHQLVAKGLRSLLEPEFESANDIARTLSISPWTADFHKARVLRVLRLGSTAELIQYGIRHGWKAIVPPRE